jgi:hypothetical protein
MYCTNNVLIELTHGVQTPYEVAYYHNALRRTAVCTTQPTLQNTFKSYMKTKQIHTPSLHCVTHNLSTVKAAFHLFGVPVVQTAHYSAICMHHVIRRCV